MQSEKKRKRKSSDVATSEPKLEAEKPDLSHVREAYAERKEGKKPSTGGRNYVSKKAQEQQKRQELEEMAEGFSTLTNMVAQLLAQATYPEMKPTPEEMDILNKTTTKMIQKYGERIIEYSVEVSFAGAIAGIVIPRLYMRYMDNGEKTTQCPPQLDDINEAGIE